ncbi:hypothetical protein NFI96_012235 [Prochilodus magdalenae]|nr:hypothetical protein NFI96_012235 [Prochilodus magdalenae]
MGERSAAQKPPYDGLCNYAQKITSCFGLDELQIKREWTAVMPSLPTLNSLGKLCGSGRSQQVDSTRIKRKPSVKRRSVIEDGHVAEVLYLIPKQSMMQQLPFINPDDYYLTESLAPVAHAQEAQHQTDKPLIQCYKCGEPCKGEVLRVQNKHFHIKCFTCKVCGCDLAQGGFFMKNGDYLCTLDYQRIHGTRCNSCGEFVEGEVVTALGKTYHPACFVCTICKRPFPAGDRVTFNGKDCLCQYCAEPMSPGPTKDITGPSSEDGAPYCEKDYQIHFGVKCEACHQFITGKVLEAGDKHYHPSCARCSRCNQMFTEGEEMYLQGSTVWHPGCKSSTRAEDRHRVRPLGPVFTRFDMMELGSIVFHASTFLCREGCSAGFICWGDATKLWHNYGNGSTTKIYLSRQVLVASSKPVFTPQPTRSSSESMCSRPGSSIPGSPGHTIYAKVDNEILDYRDLAAIPKVKAIYDIERPDLINYEPLYTTSLDETKEEESVGELQTWRRERSPMPDDRPYVHFTTHEDTPSGFPPVMVTVGSVFVMSCLNTPRTMSPTPSADSYYDMRGHILQRSTSQGSIGSPIYSRHSYTPTLSRSPQHFHRPDQSVNIYRKPPIYKQHVQHPCFTNPDSAAFTAQSKSADDIIKSAKFPSAYAPRPDDAPKIETDYWPCPPASAALGSDGRRRSQEEDEEELQKRRQLQEEHLIKVTTHIAKQ